MTKTRDLADLGGGFIQAGTGAVQRTVESKLQDVVSVKDFIPPGTDTATTNCTAFIISAIAAATASKKILFFPSGTYLCNGVLGNFSCSAVGDGLARSIIKYTGNSEFTTFTGTYYENLEFQAPATHNSYFTKTPAAFISFNNCKWDATGATAGALLYMNQAINVEINGCFFNGSNIGVIGQDGGGAGFCNGVTISNTLFGAYTTAAIANGGQGWTLQNVIFEHKPAVGGTVGLKAIYTDSTCQWLGLKFNGCWFGDNTAPNQKYIDFRGNGLSIEGCYINGEGTNSGSVVNCVGTCSGISITGNYISNFSDVLNINGQTVTDVFLAANKVQSTANQISGVVASGMLSQLGVNTNEIRFPSSQQASNNPNYLDDYEEGTWTPQLISGGAFTYTSQVGRYTKIGRQVTLYYNIQINTASSTTSGAVGMSLPFACVGAVAERHGYPGIIGLQTTSNTGIRYTGFYDDSSTVFFYGPSTTLIGTEVGNTNIISGSMTYFTAT
jgi:hypothetical protein